MKRGFLILVIALFVMVFALPQEGQCRKQKNMYELLSGKKKVMTYVAPIKDSSKKAGQMVEALEKAMIDALVTRMTIRFEPVSVPEEADIIISCDILELERRKSGLLGQIKGGGVEDNHARMQAYFAVKDAKNGKTLWEQKIQATVTEKGMPEGQSEALLEERIIDVFMRKCFSLNAKP